MKFILEEDYLISNMGIKYKHTYEKLTDVQLLKRFQEGIIECYDHLGKGKLNKLDRNDILENWSIQYAEHICFDEEASLGDYKNGYLYFVSIYQSTDYDQIVILNYSH